MNKSIINRAANDAFILLLNAITEFVRQNGEDMNEYFYNEFGINEEDYGEKVLKVLNVSNPGCYFATQDEVNADYIKKAIDRSDYGLAAYRGFEHHAIWALYIVKETDGKEYLKYYEFYNSGIAYDDSSEPDHSYAKDLDIAKLWYIIEALNKL